MIAKNVSKVMAGIRHQIKTNDSYWPQYKDGKDKNWFYEGRKIARKLIKRGLLEHINKIDVLRAQKELAETYRIVHRSSNMRLENGVCIAAETEPNVEPCVECCFIVFCREKDMNCQYYRSWARERTPRVKKMWPDKTWDEWKHEEEFDELLQHDR